MRRWMMGRRAIEAGFYQAGSLVLLGRGFECIAWRWVTGGKDGSRKEGITSAKESGVYVDLGIVRLPLEVPSRHQNEQSQRPDPKPPLLPLPLLILHRPILLQPNRLHANKPRRLAWLKTPNLIHTALTHIVQPLRLAAASQHAKPPFVHPAPHLPIHLLLACHDSFLQKLALGREVQPVVEHLGVVEGDELVAQRAHFAVEHQAFEVEVGGPQARQPGRFVAAAGLHADEAVFDDVDAADAVAAGDGVDGQEEVERVRDGFRGAGFVCVDELGGEPLFEEEGEVFGGVGRAGGVDGQFPHVGGGCGVGVLEDAGFVGAVGEVFVHAPGLGFGGSDGDVLLRGVVEEVVAAGETGVEFGDAPGGDDFDGGLESVEGEFEAHLVVAFAGTAVRDGDAVFLLRYGDLGAGDDGAGEGCACGEIAR